MTEFTIRPVIPGDWAWVRAFIVERWRAPVVVALGELFHPDDLPGFLAEADGERIGLVTYRIDSRGCEIVTLDSVRKGLGVGSALVEAVREVAVTLSCERLWVITTNDNLDALRFYQRRGFRLAALHRGAVDAARRIKPTIPDDGVYGIPLHDEIELEMPLAGA
jgi:GNAT superfamily N-acetyltransferase